LSDPGYAKNLAGLIQALHGWTAPVQRDTELDVFPQFTQSAIFLFTLLFVFSMNFGRSAEKSRDRAAIRAPA